MLRIFKQSSFRYASFIVYKIALGMKIRDVQDSKFYIMQASKLEMFKKATLAS